MSTLSTFQTLPMHIAEAIANYRIENYRILHSRIELEKHSRRTWKIFYNVSNIWRVLALRHYCRKLSVTLNKWPRGKVSFVDLPYSIKIHKHFYSYVKALTLDLRHLALEPYSVIAKSYNEIWPDGITLTSASILTILFARTPYEFSDADISVENEKLLRLLQRIRIWMPRLREVEPASYKDNCYKPVLLPNTTEPRLDSMFVDIFKRAFKLEVPTWPTLLDGRDAQLLDGSLITSLSYIISEDMEFLAIVLQRIGPTLESLEIDLFHSSSIEALVYNSDGSPIVYSLLKRLCISGCYGLQHADFTRIHLTATPFPSLRYLTWMSDYPFNDDVLFRGCHDTLEYLQIRFDKTALNMLERHATASSGRYMHLRHLFVRKDPDLADAENSYDRLLKLGVSLVSPVTQTFTTDSNCSWNQVCDTFSTCGYAVNIRVLSLEGTELRLLEILNLIKLLPNMADFACCFNERATDTHKRKNRTVVDRLYSGYYPLSQHLKCWEIKEGLIRVNQAATAAITLAVLCPSFTFVAVPIHRTNAYQAALKEAIGSRAYRRHRDKIQRLIYD